MEKRIIDLSIFDKLRFKDLQKQIQMLGIDTADKDRDQLKETIFKYSKEHDCLLREEGVLEIVRDNTNPSRCWGYLRRGNFKNNKYDIYVAHTQICKFGLRNGDIITGLVRMANEKERYNALIDLESVNYQVPCRDRTPFLELTPIHPNKWMSLELPEDIAKAENINNTSLRVVDLFAPVGFGTRGLIVAPPKTGKTTLLKDIAKSITIKYPETYLIILLVDERPEEVTDIERSIYNKKYPKNVRVVSSTFDEDPKNHIRVSSMVMEISKRQAESGKNVVVLLDSITRMARASNLTTQSSGILLSGGINPKSLYIPKGFLGMARNLEEGGSITIIGTALVDTGSAMDNAIFEEFKATGNMELVLNRDLAEIRVFPAVDIKKSGTRHDELLFKPFEYTLLSNIRRKLLKEDDSKVIGNIESSGCNSDLLLENNK